MMQKIHISEIENRWYLLLLIDNIPTKNMLRIEIENELN